MSWAIERDKDGMPVRMWWIGREPKREPRKIASKPRCPRCGFADGWHTVACAERAKVEAI